MSILKMSEVAYNDFKELLDQNNVENYVIRINLAGMGWGGPVFNIVLDEQKDTDVVEKINDITFLVDKNLVADFEGFEITCTAENGRGLSLEPLKKTDGGGCGSCGSGCGH